MNRLLEPLTAKKQTVAANLIVTTLCLLAQTGQAQQLPPVEVHFSPKGGCSEVVVRELEAAKETVLVQAYRFTSTPIAKALDDAR